MRESYLLIFPVATNQVAYRTKSSPDTGMLRMPYNRQKERNALTSDDLEHFVAGAQAASWNLRASIFFSCDSTTAGVAVVVASDSAVVAATVVTWSVATLVTSSAVVAVSAKVLVGSVTVLAPLLTVHNVSRI